MQITQIERMKITNPKYKSQSPPLSGDQNRNMDDRQTNRSELTHKECQTENIKLTPGGCQVAS